MVKFSSMVVVTKLPPHHPVALLYNDPSQIPSFGHTHNFGHMANGRDSFFSSLFSKSFVESGRSGN